jgi:hypothetical protein
MGCLGEDGHHAELEVLRLGHVSGAGMEDGAVTARWCRVVQEQL